MRLHSGLDSKQLLGMLQDTLRKEKSTWKPAIYSNELKEENTISPLQRDEIVQWIAQLNKKFQFYPETFALSVGILDRFLQIVKARPKYLRVIAVSCFYLAAKTLEEDEVIPGINDLVDDSDCGCTVAEILRMERIILDKLQWTLRHVTALEFLHIFHALLLSTCPHLLDQFPHMTVSRQLSVMTQKLELCLRYHHLASYPPSLLALSLVSLELELFKPDWLQYTINMQRLTLVENKQLICCREIISRHLASCRLFFHGSYQPISTVKPGKRKMEQLSDDDGEDDTYDLQCLYNEDVTLDVSVILSCAGEVHQDSEDLSPLQSVTAN